MLLLHNNRNEDCWLKSTTRCFFVLENNSFKPVRNLQRDNEITKKQLNQIVAAGVCIRQVQIERRTSAQYLEMMKKQRLPN